MVDSTGDNKPKWGADGATVGYEYADDSSPPVIGRDAALLSEGAVGRTSFIVARGRRDHEVPEESIAIGTPTQHTERAEYLQGENSI
ncbi:hypothetical protein [Natrialba swarupiae]|uniref:Uncharacterized protein n=1 Tax=Natrialba swarupiae TaxID=2448032 RepID=A0A5D5AIX7_9EURY|nr:hypothetical protein [Natrialba swarupiae]TYT60975.1 hypothetical protein FYC77_15895 [Natrialba swarupiae]